MLKYASWRLIQAVLFALFIFGEYYVVMVLSRIFPKYFTTERLQRFWIFQARQIRYRCLRFRGLFIKAGQFMSSMANLFAREFAKELEHLQDRVPSLPFSRISERIEAELGMKLEEAFASIKKQAIAAASLGQVHKAYLHTGECVAVKVLYPGIDRVLDKDMRAIKVILRISQYIFPWVNMKNISREFESMIIRETNYEEEAINLNKIRENFGNSNLCILPESIPSLSTKNILTLTWIDGYKITDTEKMKELGINQKDMARQLISIYAHMFFEHRFFHADPHAGNVLFVSEKYGEGKIALVDFGCVESISEQARTGVQHVILGAVEKDYHRVVDGMEQIGLLTSGAERNIIEEFLKRRIERVFSLDKFSNISMKDINFSEDLESLSLGLRDLMKYFQVPRNYLFFARSVWIIVGTISVLDDSVDIARMAMPHIKRFASLDKKTQFGFNALVDKLRHIVGLGPMIQRVFERIDSGSFAVGMQNEIKSLNRKIQRAQQRIILSTVACSCLIVSLFYRVLVPDSWIITICYISASICGWFFFRSFCRR